MRFDRDASPPVNLGKYALTNGQVSPLPGTPPASRVSDNRVQLEEPRTCGRSVSGILIACPLELRPTEEGTAMAKIMGALITAIFVAAALLEWVAMRR